MKFKNFFDSYDLQGVQHTGFLQSMDFSGLLTDAPFVSEITMAFMDAYLFNRLSDSLVLRQWKQYMAYNKNLERFEIASKFYTDFVPAIAAQLFKRERWFELTQTDFHALSATDIYTFEHGQKETEKEHGAQEREKEYGQRETENEYGKTTTTKNYDKVNVVVERGDDTHVVGAAHTEGSGTTVGLVYPLGASAYVDDTKTTQSSEQDTDAQTNRDTFGNVETETLAREDSEEIDTHTDTITQKTYTDTDTLKTYTDTDTIKAYTDTERRTRFVILSPEKYFAIQKELAEIGAYELMECAVKDTMILNCWDDRNRYF